MDPRILIGVVILGLFALAVLGVAALLLIVAFDPADFAGEAKLREAERIARGWQA